MISIELFVETSLLAFSIVSLSYGKSLPSTELQATLCNPTPSSTKVQYIVGYGSLMETASKNRTYPNTGENIPISVHGFSREWNLKGATVTLSTTYLGIAPQKDAIFNGAMFQLPPSTNIVESLISYDKRESYYCRQRVPLEDIKVLSQIQTTNSSTGSKKNEYWNEAPVTNTNAQYWIYVNKPEFTAEPSDKFPIVQSYVDVFISGCFELEKKYNLTHFASTCIDSTKGWSSSNWVNDRIYPRRPFVYQPNAGKIDKLLAEKLPVEFSKIRIEG